jgi:MYND finger/SET domain
MPLNNPKTIESRGTKFSPRGRSLHALRRFSPGDRIAHFTSPLISLPASPNALETCNHCLVPSRPSKPKLRACSGCKRVVYCGPACQKANWTLIHAKECKVFKKRADDLALMPTPVRGLVHVLLRDDLRTAFEDLEGNVGGFRAEKAIWADLGLQAIAGLKFTGQAATDEAVTAAIEVLCKIQTNSFDRYDADSNESGIFLHATLAMANHSCIPNAGVTCIGRTAVMRAILPIQEDEEIVISYTGKSYVNFFS